MKGEKLLVTMADIKRYKVLKDVIEKKLKGTEAAQLLTLNNVHIWRLKKRLRTEDFAELLRRSLTMLPRNEIPEQDNKAIIRLVPAILLRFQYHAFYGETQ